MVVERLLGAVRQFYSHFSHDPVRIVFPLAARPAVCTLVMRRSFVKETIYPLYP